MHTLRQLRVDKKLTLEKISKQLGVDLSTLSRIERAVQYPNRKTAEKIADYYGISVGEVFDLLVVVDEKAD